MADLKTYAGLVDGQSVDEVENHATVERIRQQQRDINAEWAAKARQAEAASNASIADTVPRVVALANTHTEAELRAQLADMIDQYNRAASVCETAKDNLARARRRVTDAESELAIYNDVDERITQWRVNQVKTNRSEPMPRELMEAQSIRSTVAELVVSTRSAVTHLEIELKQANDKLQQAEIARAKAGVTVITKYANAIATQITDAMAVIADCRDKLRAIASVWARYSEHGAAIPLSQAATHALNAPLTIDSGNRPPPTDTVKDFFEKLILDAAEPGPWMQ